jgi:hypothetical protein
VLRITRLSQKGRGLTINLEGAIAGAWVGAARDASASRGRRPRRLDLAAVTYVDAAGIQRNRTLPFGDGPGGGEPVSPGDEPPLPCKAALKELLAQTHRHVRPPPWSEKIGSRGRRSASFLMGAVRVQATSLVANPGRNGDRLMCAPTVRPYAAVLAPGVRSVSS